MLRRSLTQLIYQCSTKAPNMVNINVEMKGKRYTFQFPENTKLAPNLERVRVPLEF